MEVRLAERGAWAGLWRAARDDLLDALYPRRCAVCGGAAPDGLACAAHALPLAPPGARCGRCAAPLPSGLALEARCSACRIAPPSFGRTIALADYRAQREVRDWLMALKYGGRVDLAQPLGRALASAWRASAAADPRAVLVPVPLHRWRRFERGYDQALALARAISAETGVPLRRWLARARATAVQGGPGSVSRAANVRGAFAATRQASRAARKGELAPVWLVDDVVTSGATASECARVLRRLGVTEVGVLAVACAAHAPAGATEARGDV